jgi:uncharacterized protein (UPF0276 family)
MAGLFYVLHMNKFGYKDLGFGLGLRAQHYDHIIENRPAIDWFEIITENYIDTHQGYWEFLSELRRTYPMVMHGVSLSIGSPDPLDMNYLDKVKKLANHLDVPWLSDHLCFTGAGGRNTHDLLPVPYTSEMLEHIVGRIKKVQDHLGRNIVLENPSSYLEFAASHMSENEFMVQMAEKADCGILLDINNIYVSAFNHNFDAKEYIDSIPAERIVQIHLAGHTHKGDMIIDTHSDHVVDDVWRLYRYTIETKGKISTMVEWDENIPDFAVLQREIEKARDFI